MYRRLALAIAAGVAISACADDREQSPTAPGSTITPEFTTGATCNYTDVKKYARNLFGTSGPGSLGYKLAGEMSKFGKDTPQATNLAFDIFAEIARKRNATTGTWTTANRDDAANLTVEVIKCANVSLTADINFSVPAQVAGLLANLKLALTTPTGGYEVRGGVSGTLAGSTVDPETSVLTTDTQSGVAPDGQTWLSWFGARTLLYGYPTTSFAGESIADVIGPSTYDWSLVRKKTGTTTPAYTGLGKVTVCLTVSVEAATPEEAQLTADKFRLQKTNSILEVATDVSGVTCLIRTASSSFSSKLVDLALDLVAPSKLYAAAFGKLPAGTSPTGSAGSFSSFQGGNPDSTLVTWTNPPADGTLAGIPGTDGGAVKVSVTGEAFTPWVGVWLHIYGVDNNGAKTDFGGSCAITDGAGIATFGGLDAPKTGGFNLYVETQSTVCDPDASVTNYTPVVVQAPSRINVRP